MSVQVGIDVHRKRSQVAVVTEEGTVRVNRNVVNGVAPTIEALDREIHARATMDPRVTVLTAPPRVGEFTALVLLAEIGDIARFDNARKLAGWAGLTPTVRGSDTTVHHGHISTQGSPYVRWVLGQAAHIAKRHPEFAGRYRPSPHAAAARSPPPRWPASR